MLLKLQNAQLRSGARMQRCKCRVSIIPGNAYLTFYKYTVGMQTPFGLFNKHTQLCVKCNFYEACVYQRERWFGLIYVWSKAPCRRCGFNGAEAS